jgi:DNA-binding CsgD family transcriptional regulator
MVPVCHAAVAEAEAMAGRAEEARAALQRGYATQGAGRSNSLADDSLHLARVLVLAAEGNHVEAQEIALKGAQATGEAVLIEAERLHLYMRVGGAPRRVAPRLNEIAAASRAGMAELWARQALAAHDGDGAKLEAVAAEFERVGARIFAAEAAAQAAVAHGAGGSDDARRRAEGRAARLASACGAGGLTLVTTMRMSALTAREQQTARLVARGLSNAEIAARLSLSVRTVESHIYRATTKLGLHDRAALGALLAGTREVG